LELAECVRRQVASSSGQAAPVIFELSARNADKPPLQPDVVHARIDQFTRRGLSIVVTSCPLFVEKARMFPGCYFVIGADTASRLVDPRYYKQDPREMVAALGEIKALGCRFYVAGRKSGDIFETWSSILDKSAILPESLLDLFVEISAEDFRSDISSTEIRAREAKAQGVS